MSIYRNDPNYYLLRDNSLRNSIDSSDGSPIIVTPSSLDLMRQTRSTLANEKRAPIRQSIDSGQYMALRDRSNKRSHNSRSSQRSDMTLGENQVLPTIKSSV